MKIIEQSHDVLFHTGIEMLEIAGRTCYQSQEKIGCTEPVDQRCDFISGKITFKGCKEHNCQHHSSHKFVEMLVKREQIFPGVWAKSSWSPIKNILTGPF